MNFLDQIWLIPLFPLLGAALMLLFGKKLDPLDFPKTAKEDYGIHACEYVNQFYKEKKKDDDVIDAEYEVKE